MEDKIRIVLSVLAGEVTVAEAARQAKVSEQSAGSAAVPAGPEKATTTWAPAAFSAAACEMAWVAAGLQRSLAPICHPGSS